MALIIDASVALKWFIDESSSEEARQLLADEAERLAPDLIVAEICNAARRRSRMGDISEAHCRFIADAIGGHYVEFRSSARLAPRATEIALLLNHPIYDCFYLALAEAEASTLITADQRFAARLSGTAWKSIVRTIGA